MMHCECGNDGILGHFTVGGILWETCDRCKKVERVPTRRNVPTDRSKFRMPPPPTVEIGAEPEPPKKRGRKPILVKSEGA